MRDIESVLTPTRPAVIGAPRWRRTLRPSVTVIRVAKFAVRTLGTGSPAASASIADESPKYFAKLAPPPSSALHTPDQNDRPTTNGAGSVVPPTARRPADLDLRAEHRKPTRPAACGI